MGLSSTLSLIGSSFASNAAQTAVVSRNIANANVAGYTRELANVVTTYSGGSEVESIQRQTNEALLLQASDATSAAASQQAIADGLTKLAATVDDSSSATSTSGATANGSSPSAMLANLQSALQTCITSPDDASSARAAVVAAKTLATSLNGASSTVQTVREQADSDMASSVATINTLLAKYSAADKAVVAGLNSGADVSNALDTRDSVLSQLAQQVGISTSAGVNGSLSIYTDSGVALYQGNARTLTFQQSTTLTDGSSGASVSVDGIQITGTNAPMAIHSGALAGYSALRDVVAPQYQAQLDQIAQGLISSFSESDQTGSSTASAQPGLFTYSGATAVPSPSNAVGLAAAIKVNANVDPDQGGDVTRLRDGAISDPGNSAYDYNSSGAAGFTGRLRQLVANLSQTQSFDSSAGLGTSSSLTDYASASVSWLQDQNQNASNQADYQNALSSQATSAYSSATGVNLDTEMTALLSLENSYTTTAKLLTTVTDMFSSLMNAVGR